jgi:TPR repeat protein
MMRVVFGIFMLLTMTAVLADDDEAVQERIFNSYLEQAQHGDANAQFIVASRYENGKGISKDLQKAYYWFEKAAKNGQPLAQLKIDDRAEARAAVASKTIAVSAPEPTHDVAPAPKTPAHPVPKERVAKPKEHIAKSEPVAHQKELPRSAPAKPQLATIEPVRVPEPSVITRSAISEKPPAPNINIAQAVLGGKWGRNRRAAEILPSPLSTCLQTSATEIVCFSQELTRNVNGHGITYTVKATLNGIGNRDSHLSISYLYNVIDVNSKPFSQTNSSQADFADLAARTGWQDPGTRLDCRLNDEHNLACTRPDRKLSYQFVRD